MSLVGVGLGLSLTAAAGRGDEVSAGASASGLAIHGPGETLRDYCREEDGALWLVLPGGTRFELVTSTSDPLIANAGDGSFHPFDESVVREALSQVRFPIGELPAEVYILPYPRRTGLQSAAGARLILLSPGVMALTAEQQHAQVVHELGHVVQYALMPDAEVDLWSRYRQLRGITDTERFRADAPHADRPHEIFAEDFRALFGGALANYSGTIENATLCMPQKVSGLDAFMMGLAGTSLVVGRLEAFPNPSRGAVGFRRQGGAPGPIDLFDLAGRRVAMLAPRPSAGGWSWRWDGRDERGNATGPGVVFARVRGSVESGLRLVVTR